MSEKKKTSVIACIFARGGSKGVPRKNIRDFNGKPLIAWTIELAKSLHIFDDIIVSTDSTEIAEIARQYGAKTPFLRPAELASDAVAERLAWRHAVENLPPFDIMASLPATVPLRRPETVLKCLELFQQGDAEMVITITPSKTHPSFSMVSLDDNGYAHLLDSTDKMILRRQDAQKVFNMTPVCYLASPRIIMKHNRIMTCKVKTVIVDEIEAVDIDTMLDFEIASFLHAKKLKGIYYDIHSHRDNNDTQTHKAERMGPQ